MKTRTIRPELWKYMKKELEIEKVPYEYNGGDKLTTALSSALYHRMIERSMCKEQQDKTKSRVPVVSYKMWIDGELPTERRSFCFLIKDKELFHRELGIKEG